MTATNREIRELAPVLNSPTVSDGATEKSSDPKVPIDIMVKRREGATYIFAVGMRNAPARASFEVPGVPAKAEAEAIGEGRKFPVEAGKFEDDFGPYEVRLYRVR